MTQEGLYCYANHNLNMNLNTIIFQKDVITLISSLCQLTSHGYLDEKITVDEKKQKILKQKLSLTCGYTVVFVSDILNEYGIENRIIYLLTSKDINGYSDGHIVLEVKINGEWILFDLTLKRYFKYKKKYLNCLLLTEKDIDFKSLKSISLSSQNDLIDSQNSIYTNGVNYNFLSNYTFNHVEEYYDRVYQIPIIRHNGKLISSFKNESFSKRVLEFYPDAIIVNKNIFKKELYN